MAKTHTRIAAAAAILCACPVLAAAQAVNPAPSAASAVAQPPAAAVAPTPPAATTGAQANANAAVPALTSGLAVKDNTGATIGQIASLQTDASGKQMAVIKMGTDTFSVAVTSLAVQDGAAVINLTHAQLNDMLHKPKS
ncbi:MAG: hypothetical protein ACYC8V_12655 [Caulobacteraceae bacterium]